MSTQRWQVRTGADIGRAIAQARQANGLTQADLARSVGLDRTYLARLEAGQTVLLLERALRILRRLGVDVMLTMAPTGEGSKEHGSTTRGSADG